MEWRSRTRRHCRLRSGRPTLREFLRAERGGALIEIMMASLLVVMVATAVFKGIDGANATSSGSKSRATAAAIAEADQERLRAVPPAQLVNRNETRTLRRNDVTYTVQSSTRWVADRDATPDCNTTTSRAGYLRIRSQVTWPDMRGSKPIVQSSLVAPPNGTVTTNLGAIGIKILNEANVGVPGVNVSVSGGGIPAKVTDNNGCAYWDEVPQGNYNYTASKTGYVDYEGDTSVTRPIGVAGGQTRFDTAYLDVAQTMNIEYVTRRYGGSEVRAQSPGPTPAADNLLLSEYSNYPLRLANAKMAGLGGIRAFPPSITPAQTTRTITGLYPMDYGVYLGPCANSSNPANWTAATYNTPAWSINSYTVAPPYANPVKVHLPSINVRGRLSGNYAAANGVQVRITQLSASGDSCSTQYTRTFQNVSGVGDGALPRPEFPPGRYRLCTQVNQSGWWHAQIDVNNFAPAGTPTITLDESMAQAGQCP